MFKSQKSEFNLGSQIKSIEREKNRNLDIKKKKYIIVYWPKFIIQNLT